MTQGKAARRSASLWVGKLLLVGLLLSSVPLPASPKEEIFRGEISDQLCGLSHPAVLDDAGECTRKCVQGGSQYILVDKGKQAVYDLYGKSIPEELAGRQVTVRGRWNKQRKAIFVYSIAPAV